MTEILEGSAKEIQGMTPAQKDELLQKANIPSDLFQSETVPYDWEEHEFEHDGTSLDTHGHSGDNGKSATKLKQRGLAIYNYLRGMGSLSGR